MRSFNIAGPCEPLDHYMVPPEARTPDLTDYLERKAYFVVHAPRQSGKTTAMRALAARLSAEGRYAALHVSCETARVFADEIAEAERRVWFSLEQAASQRLPAELRPPAIGEAPAGGLLSAQLARWAEICPRPLVLIFDEIDALEGRALRSVLSQLRDGYSNRPRHFPSTIIRCGMKDVRDYKLASGSSAPSRSVRASPGLRTRSRARSSARWASIRLTPSPRRTSTRRGSASSPPAPHTWRACSPACRRTVCAACWSRSSRAGSPRPIRWMTTTATCATSA